MKTKYIIALAIMVLMNACSDNKYEPGQAPAEGNPGVCFINTENYYTFGSNEDTYEATIYLHREKTDGALTVPITKLYCDNMVTIPASATFAAGDDTASFKISLAKSAVELKKYRFGLALPDDLVDFYADGPGVGEINCSMVVTKTYEAKCYVAEYSSPFAPIGDILTTYVNQIDEKSFRVADFLGSGQPLMFMLESGNGLALGGSWLELDDEYQEDYGYSFYWMGENPFYAGLGDGVTITELNIYYGSSYTRYSLNKNTGEYTFYLSGYYLTNNNASYTDAKIIFKFGATQN